MVAVSAQALADFDGERGVVKAMIRKSSCKWLQINAYRAVRDTKILEEEEIMNHKHIRCLALVFLLLMLLSVVGHIAKGSPIIAQELGIEFENLTKLSPNGEQIAYVTADNLGMQHSKIWIADTDGTDKYVLVAGGDDFWVTNPIWSPDGETIAYVKIVNVPDLSYAINSMPEMWVVYLEDGTTKQLLDTTEFRPALGYGGQTDISWVSNNAIEFVNQNEFPATRYQVDIHTGNVERVGIILQPFGILAQPSNVPCFSQHDPLWACDQLGYNEDWTMGVCATKPDTQSGGCAVTSVAMVLKYFGVNTDPGQLNQWLKDNAGFTGAQIYWAIAANIDSSIEFTARIDSTDWNRLRSELDAGYPVVLQVNNGGHYVVATGYSGNTYYINDPGYSSCTATLSRYNNTFSGMRIYHGPIPGCTDVADVGEGSSRQQMFIDAYNRNNGDTNLGCTENTVGWWPLQPPHVTRQDFTVSDTYGDAVIVHDEDNEAATPNTIPAYVVHGGILGNYLESGNLVNYGPATSDEFTNQQGVPQSNFGHGYVTWEGNAVWHPWPTSFSGWKAEYYNYDLNANDSNNTPTVDYPTMVRNENVDKPDYDWGEGAPEDGHIGVFADKFSVRWTRTVNFSTAGLYRFSTHSDDGVRVWVDDSLIIDHWADGGDQNYSGDINLSAGDHTIKIEYYENGGFAYFSIDWTLADTTPPTQASNVRPNGWTGPYTEDITPAFRWDAATDGGSGLAGYYVAVDDWTPEGSYGNDWWVGNVTNYQVPNDLPEGEHIFAVTSKDNAGNVNPTNTNTPGDAPYYTFYADLSAPDTPQLTVSGSGCSGIPNNGWQNTCREPVFNWTSDDSVSGVKDYRYYWGTSSSGAPDTTTTETSFSPAAIAPADGFASYYLHVTARDELNHESGRKSFGVRYDAAPPTVTLAINNDAATTNQVSVWLDLTASDKGSGVSQVRFSNNGLDWTDWETYNSARLWTLPSLDRRTNTVYVQVRDRAGNESTIASDSITLDLYPVMPHSVSYRICDDVVDVGGSVGLTSTSYSLVSAIGQPWATGGDANSSAMHTEHSGFLAAVDGCRPITRSVTTNYTVTQWVVASGGNLRGSTSYRLGDTAGQPAASGTGAFTSTSYVLSSGFWAQITGTVPSTSTVKPTPIPPTPTPIPTPGPTPTPQPGGFGVSINDGALYTNDPEVTVNTWAPNVTQVRLSNDGGYADDGWTTYQLTHTWVISTYGAYVMPRTVYAWFEDDQAAIYGPYQDDIIYDPIPPQGSVRVLGSTQPGIQSATSVITLSLEASDDNSGVAQMRLSEDLLEIESGTWQPFTSTVTWTLQSDVVYAQFRDSAGNKSPLYGSDGSEHALESRPLSVTISGPAFGYTGTAQTFTAEVLPVTATVPITYIWQATGQSPVTHATTLQPQDVLSFTWDVTGTKTLTVSAMNRLGVATDTYTSTIVGGTPACPRPLLDVDIQRVSSGTLYIDTLYAFRAVPTPVDATPLITYTWAPYPDLGQGSAYASYSWQTTGIYTITLAAQNCGGIPFEAQHVVTVQDEHYFVYLPLVLRAAP